MSKSQTAQQYWGKRLLAYIIDAILLSVIVGALVSIIAFPLIFGYGWGYQFYQPYSWFGLGPFPLLGGIITVLYFTFTESRYGASLGKMLMGLKVTMNDGRRLTMDKAVTRNISKVHWALLLLDVIVGLATEPDYRKKFTDKYAGTIVTPK